MDGREFSAKTVSEAITKACMTLEITSDALDYEVVSEGSNGFLGIGARPAVIIARIKRSEEESKGSEEKMKVPEEKNPGQIQDGMDVPGIRESIEFLNKIFEAMKIEVSVTSQFDGRERALSLDLKGQDMGILIGKRGQTLDSLQYLVSLIANKHSEGYIRVKLDTENYRERRKETLETLARNIAYKVRKTKRLVVLESMNPYERRVIHAALQNDKYVTTRSEGEEPYRHVVIAPKREYVSGDRNGRYDRNRNGRYDQNSGGYRGGSRRNSDSDFNSREGITEQMEE